MQVVVRHRMNGKTEAMIEWMRKEERGEKRFAVVRNTSELHRLRNKYPDVNPARFLSSDAVKSGALYGETNAHLAFDNAEQYLWDVVRGTAQIDLVTITGEV